MRYALRHVGVLCVATLAVGCAPADDVALEADCSDGFDNRDAAAIIQECGAEEGSLWVEDGGAVRFQPSPQADYEAAACVLTKINESGTTRFGFVGNEMYRVDEESE